MPTRSKTIGGKAPKKRRRSRAEDDLAGGNAGRRRRRDGDMPILEAFDRYSKLGKPSPDEYARHRIELKEFLEWARIRDLSQITLDIAVDWVSILKRRGGFYDGIRHRILGLRQACRYAPSLGLPDPLAGYDLLAGVPRRTVPAAWTLEEIAKVILQTEDQTLKAVVGLGAFMGLRPSEIAAASVDHVSNHRLHTGRKNTDSIRDLPIPATVEYWLRSSQKAPCRADVLSHKHGDQLKTLTGRNLPVKCLRKTFATWTYLHGLDGVSIEYYQGHKLAARMGEENLPSSETTMRHYVDRQQLIDRLCERRFLPFSVRIEAIITDTLHAVAPGHTSGGPHPRTATVVCL